MMPFFINIDLNPLNPERITMSSSNLLTKIFTTVLKKIHNQAQKSLEDANKRMKRVGVQEVVLSLTREVTYILFSTMGVTSRYKHTHTNAIGT